MNEQELRTLVREAVRRHLGPGAAFSDAAPSTLTHAHPSSPGPTQPHSSHHLYAGLINVTDACVIEPAVACDHCGYCKSHGH
jgi:hypothetical protein